MTRIILTAVALIFGISGWSITGHADTNYDSYL